MKFYENLAELIEARFFIIETNILVRKVEKGLIWYNLTR